MVDALRAAPRGHATGHRVGESLNLHQQRSLTLQRGHHRRTGHTGAPIGEEQPAGVGHPLQAVAGHLEHAELVGGSEAVLHGAQEAERVMPISFEGQHGVDYVLEHARAGQPALLRDVPNEHDGYTSTLRFADQTVGAFAYLYDAAGCRRHIRVSDGLDAVDHHKCGLGLFDGGHDVGQRRFGQQPQVGLHCTEALGAHPHLLRAFLGTHVQRACGPFRQ